MEPSRPPGEPSHEAYPAPPPWRPLSAMAVTALVLALLGGFFAIVGLWWVEAIPLVAGIVGLDRARPAVRRGRVLAILAIGVALAAGTLGFVMHRNIEKQIEDHLDRLLRALDGGHKDDAAAFAAPDGDPAAAVERWTERLQAVRAELGRYVGPATVGNVMMGVAAAFGPPENVVEMGPAGGETPRFGEALWARARFEKGDAWLAFLGRGQGREGSVQLMEDMGRGFSSARPAWLRDVRAFRERP